MTDPRRIDASIARTAAAERQAEESIAVTISPALKVPVIRFG
jgi:hypothetical protein